MLSYKQCYFCRNRKPTASSYNFFHAFKIQEKHLLCIVFYMHFFLSKEKDIFGNCIQTVIKAYYGKYVKRCKSLVLSCQVTENLQKSFKLVCVSLYRKQKRHSQRTLLKQTTLKNTFTCFKSNESIICCISLTQLFKLSTILLAKEIKKVVQGVDAN